MRMMDLKQTISHDRAIYHTYVMGLSANLGAWRLLAWSATSWSQYAVHQSKLTIHKSYGSLGNLAVCPLARLDTISWAHIMQNITSSRPPRP